MQAIIRYELVIKALRSALMLDTPDEQIDEFIRFFGKHIGCDRIYIFEDNKKYFVVSDSAIEVKMTQNLSLGVSYNMDYTNKTEKEKLDTKFLTSLIVDF